MYIMDGCLHHSWSVEACKQRQEHAATALTRASCRVLCYDDLHVVSVDVISHVSRMPQLCVLIGSTIFRLLLASGRRVEMILLGALLTAACAIITPALVHRHIIQLLAFCVFEACVGIFWPTMGTLRSR